MEFSKRKKANYFRDLRLKSLAPLDPISRIRGKSFSLYSWIDSSALHYAESFYRELKGGSLFNYLQNRFGNKRINALDLGGIGEHLFSDLESQGIHLGRTLAVNLSQKDIGVKGGGWEHEVIEGDVFLPKTIDGVKNYFKEEKVDFIISRMAMGLDWAPRDPFLLYKTLNDYYSLLGENGSMLLQVPIKQTIFLNAWKNFIRRNTKGLNIIINLPEDDVRPDDSTRYTPCIATILIEKENDAPKDLPKLSAKEVFKL